MALIFGMSLSSLRSNDDLGLFFYRSSTISNSVRLDLGTGAFGGNNIRLNNANHYVRPGNGASSPFVGAWLSSGSVAMCIYFQSASDYLRVSRTGVISVHSGSQQTHLRLSRVPSGDAWIEVGTVDGSLMVYINGILRASFLLSVPLFNGFTSGYLSNSTSYLSDPCFWDLTDSGDGFNKFPMGPIRIQTLQNTANGSINEWVPNLGQNWEATKSAGWSGGAGVETTDVGAVDMYKMDELAWDTSRILRLDHRINGMTNNEDNGSFKSRIDIRGATLISDPVQLPKSSAEPMEVATLVGDYTKDDIDAAEFGVVSA